MRDTIELAREAGATVEVGMAPVFNTHAELKRFEALVRVDEREAEREANIACIGRIAAMVGDPIDQARLHQAMDAIRARGNT